MKIENIKKELIKTFAGYKFFAEDHHYEYEGNKISIGATTLIGQYENHFDAEAQAPKSAAKAGITTEEILAEWKYKADYACDKGTSGHEYAQSLWNKEEWKRLPFDNSKEYNEAVDKIVLLADKFYKDYKNKYEHVFDEFVIGSDEFDIASAIDHLFYNKETGGLIIVDYKTNRVLKGYNDDSANKWYTKQMKPPLSHIIDLGIYHYHIQLSIYKYLIELYTNIVVEKMEIVYFTEENEDYEIIPIPYLKEEVKKILENRRVKNMNSVPVLLIGMSGSGKSASLRKFKSDEVAVVNVLGKPLPFKNSISAPKIDNYKTILNAINKTDKKTIVIDDANYLITKDFMDKRSVKGYEKFNEMGGSFYDLINGIKDIKGGKTVYLVMHEESDEYGNIQPKTIGKMLNDKINIQGMFTVCIRSMFENGSYIFRLKTNGQDCVKTPMDMFDTDDMDNDLKMFNEIVREYYDLDKEEEVKKIEGELK